MSAHREEKPSGVSGVFERILESKSSANILIIVLIILAALPLSGIAIAAIQGAAPQEIINH